MDYQTLLFLRTERDRRCYHGLGTRRPGVHAGWVEGPRWGAHGATEGGSHGTCPYVPAGERARSRGDTSPGGDSPRCLAAAVYKPDSFQDVDFISKSVGFAVGTPGSLYVTTNGGKVWLKSF